MSCGTICRVRCGAIRGEIYDKISERSLKLAEDTKKPPNKLPNALYLNAAEVAKLRSHPHDVTVIFTVRVTSLDSYSCRNPCNWFQPPAFQGVVSIHPSILWEKGVTKLFHC